MYQDTMLRSNLVCACARWPDVNELLTTDKHLPDTRSIQHIGKSAMTWPSFRRCPALASTGQITPSWPAVTITLHNAPQWKVAFISTHLLHMHLPYLITDTIVYVPNRASVVHSTALIITLLSHRLQCCAFNHTNALRPMALVVNAQRRRRFAPNGAGTLCPTALASCVNSAQAMSQQHRCIVLIGAEASWHGCSSLKVCCTGGVFA
jgi:hypothetical protein